MKNQTNTETLVLLLKHSAYNTYLATLCGGPKYLQDLFKELRNPRVGDLVMETTTHRMRDRNPVEGIGRLVRVTSEPMYTRQAWNAFGGKDSEPIPEEKIYTIELVFDDGREFRWKNADFIKVKVD